MSDVYNNDTSHIQTLEGGKITAQGLLKIPEIAVAKNAIRPGQAVGVKIIQSHASGMFQVPNSALAQHLGHTYLFLRTKTGFTAKLVEIIGKEAKKTIITSDLPENSDIAIRGAVALKANFLGLGDDE